MRLVALSGWAQAEDKRQARGAGLDRHLTVPVDLDALQSVLAGAAVRSA